jgi:hypothetical protein
MRIRIQLNREAAGMGWMEILDAILKAAVAAKEAEKERKFLEWQGDVTAKLDTIIAQNVLILEKLEELRVFFAQQLIDAFRAKDVAKLRGLAVRFDTYLGNIKKNIANNEFDQLRGDAEQWTVDLFLYGTWVFASVFAGTLMVMGIYKIVGANRKERDRFLKAILEQYRAWETSSDAGSIRWEIAQKEAEADDKLRQVKAQGGRHNIATHHAHWKEMIPAGPDDKHPRLEDRFCDNPVRGTVALGPNFQVSVTEVSPEKDGDCARGFEAAAYASAEKTRVEGLVSEYNVVNGRVLSLRASLQLLVQFRKDMEAMR